MGPLHMPLEWEEMVGSVSRSKWYAAVANFAGSVCILCVEERN